MKLSSLTAKQKRANDWAQFVETESVPPPLQQQIRATVEAFRKLLDQCWESQTISESDVAAIADFERRLELLNEEARLLARPPVGRRDGVFDGRM
jgi:hypothetical protein